MHLQRSAKENTIIVLENGSLFVDRMKLENIFARGHFVTTVISLDGPDSVPGDRVDYRNRVKYMI